jgi:hypothetical protein
MANGQLLKAVEYGPMVLAYRNGIPVDLSVVARVYDGIVAEKNGKWYTD